MRRLLSVCLAMALLSGCSIGMDVENRLRAPRQTGTREGLEKALSEFVTSSKLADGYVLKYPKSGQYRSAFIIEDFDGDGSTEALAFYRTTLPDSTEESNLIRINYLRQTEDGWKSVGDIEGASFDIDSVILGDLDGDKVKEIFIGWNVFDKRDKSLFVYSLSGNNLIAREVGAFSAMTVGRLTAYDYDDLITLNASQAVAKLWKLSGDTLKEVAAAELEPGIESFRNVLIAPISNTMKGVYLDYVKGARWTTQLLYWDGSRLVTPFYDAKAQKQVLDTSRELPIPCSDIDGDKAVEYPTCTLLPGYLAEKAEENRQFTQRWLTDFYYWDYGTQTVTKKFSCIYNDKDGYLFQLTDEMVSKITADYDIGTRTLTVYDWKDGKKGQAIFAIRTEPLRDSDETTSPGPADTREFEKLVSGPSYRYSVWFDAQSPYKLTKEFMQYQLTLLNS